LLWNQNRSPDPKGNYGKASPEVFKFFTEEVKNKGIPLHSSVPYSLTWDEADQIKKRIRKLAGRIFFGIFKYRDCRWYSLRKKEFTGCIKK
jgi:hypothetical protein